MDTEIKIEPASLADAAALLEIYAPYVTETAITFEYEVPSLEEFCRRMSGVLNRYPWLVARIDGQIAGYAYASPFKGRPAYDWAVETSIYVRKGMTRQGVGKALHQALEESLKKQNILNMNACIAFPRTDDDPYLTKKSVHFHSHLGYTMAGHFHCCGYKSGRWYDMVWMEKAIGPHQVPPRPVQPFNSANL